MKTRGEVLCSPPVQLWDSGTVGQRGECGTVGQRGECPGCPAFLSLSPPGQLSHPHQYRPLQWGTGNHRSVAGGKTNGQFQCCDIAQKEKKFNV